MESKDIDIKVAHLEVKLDDIQSDIKDIKTILSTLSGLSLKLDHQKEAITRAFDRIEKLETHQLKAEALFNQYLGLKWAAYFLWGLLSSGFIAMALKVFAVHL